MMAVFTTEDQNVAGESGPIDDGFITNAVGSLPGDPYCCTGPEPEPETTNGKRCSCFPDLKLPATLASSA